MGNVQLLKKTLEQILKFPETHNQEDWHCGTTMCIAGHAAVMAGAELKAESDGTVRLWHDGVVVSASRFADEKLGLTDFEFNYLFFCMDNETSIKRLEQIIALWEAGLTDNDMPEEDYIEIPYKPCECGCEDES